MKRAVVAIVAVVALVALAVAGIPIVETWMAGRIKAEIERDGITKVGSIEVGLLDRRIALSHLKSTGATELSIARWEVSGLVWPLSELLHGRAPLVGTRWGDPLEADRIELKDLSWVDRAAGGKWNVGSLVIDGFDLARFDARYAGAYPSEVRTARALGALAMRRLEARNTLFALPGTGDTFGVASMAIDRYGKGRIASLTMQSIEATDREGHAPLYKVADVKASGLDGHRVLGSFAADAWYPGAPAGRIQVDSASASGFSGETLARYGISLGSIGIDTVRDGDKASRSRTRIEGFVLAPPLLSREGLPLRIALQSMGLKDVKLDLDCAGSDDQAKGELAIDRCTLVGPGLGQIDFSARIVHADPAFWRAIDDGELLALEDSKAALGAARLVVVDKSLLERSLKALAAVTGRSAAEARANIAGEIRRFQPPGVLISESMTRLLDTIALFVEHGGTLAIDAKPDPPIDLAGLRSLLAPGADVVNMLGLSATLSR